MEKFGMRQTLLQSRFSWSSSEKPNNLDIYPSYQTVRKSCFLVTKMRMDFHRSFSTVSLIASGIAISAGFD